MQNTDKEIYREIQGDYYSPSIHVTTDGLIGINVDGHVRRLPLRGWHELIDKINKLLKENPNQNINYVHVGDDMPQAEGKLTTNTLPEIKLEVGKKYTLENPYWKDNPYIFLGTGTAPYEYAFENCKGEIIIFHKSNISPITEHREMIKAKEEGWINIPESIHEESFEYVLFHGVLYPSKEEAIKSIRIQHFVEPQKMKQIHIKRTIEQLYEPEET